MKKFEYKKHLFDGMTMKAARVNAGLSLKDAAEKIGTTVQTLIYWEGGKKQKPIKIFVKEKIAEVYNIDPDLIKWPNEAEIKEKGDNE